MRAAGEEGSHLSLYALLELRAGDRDAALGYYQARLIAGHEPGDTRMLAKSMVALAAASQTEAVVTVEQAAAATILRLAEAEALQGRAVEAARLFEAARLVRERAERPYSDAERGEFARVSETLHNGPGDGARTEAKAEARGPSLAQAVDLALESPELLMTSEGRGHGAEPGGRQDPVLPDGLTAREVELIRLIAAGMSNAQIADDLVLSARTVERHIENIYGKLGVHGRPARAAVAVYASRRGLLRTEV